MQLNFDASTVAPNTGVAPIEAGWYPAQIILTEQKPNKAGTGSYLEITLRISAGPNAGRTFKDRLNLQNPNQQAVEIAYGTLSAICHATGRMRVQQSAELHGGALEMFVKKVARNDKPDEMTNEISGYRALGAQGTAGYAGNAGSQQAAAPSWAQQPAPQQPAYAPPPQQTPAYAPPPAAAPQAPVYPQPAPPTPAAQPAGTPPWANEAPPAPAQAATSAPAGSVPPWAR